MACADVRDTICAGWRSACTESPPERCMDALARSLFWQPTPRFRRRARILLTWAAMSNLPNLARTIGHRGSLLCALVLVACGGSTETRDAPSSDASSGQDSDANPSEAGAGDAAVQPDSPIGDEPGPCEPYGTWRIDYDATDMCGPTLSETITVSFDSDAAADQVVFEDRGLEPSSCGPTSESKYESSGATSNDGCTVTATSYGSWCTSGEGQCEDLEIVLQIQGSTAQVTGTFRRCWCGAGPSGTTVNLSGTATRVSG